MNSIKEKISDISVPFTNYVRIKKADKAYKKLKNLSPLKEVSNKKVLFHLVRSIPSSPLSYFESILAHALKFRGADCSIVYCGGYFNDCDANYFFNSHEPICKKCSMFRNKFIDALGVPSIFYNDNISFEERTQIEKMVESLNYSEYETFFYKDVNVGYIAKNTLIRYYQHFFIPNTEEARARFKKTLIRSMLLVDIAENVYKNNKPDIMITLHGIYSAWEPFYTLLKKKGVTCYIYEFCMADVHGVRFVKNGLDVKKINIAAWEALKDRKLSSAEKTEYEQFLSERFAFKRGYITVLTDGFEQDNHNKALFEVFMSKKSKKRVAMFTNIPWDNALVYGDRLFKDIFDWFNKVITFFIENQDYQLILKVHPAERLDKHSYTFTKYLSENYPTLPENIFFMNNATAVKPYDLFDKIDLGLVYTGTLGLEMAIFGIPVLTGGIVNYTEVDGVVYPVKDQKEYFELIKNSEPVYKFAKEARETAYKYGFMFFRQIEVPMPFFKKDELAVFDPNSFTRLEEIVTKDPTIEFISRQILSEVEVVRPYKED